jgi:hypothetical protein
MAQGNLFSKAKAKGATAPAKNEKEVVEINDAVFHTTLSRLAEVNSEIDELKAEGGVLAAEVKNRGIEEMAKLYEKNLRFPGSFQVKALAEGQNPASFLFITADRYIKIDEERAEELQKKYGEEIVEESTTFIMDSKLIEKYGEVISDLIMNSTEIEDGDKEKLISAKVEYSVKKGTVQDLKTKYAAKPLNEVLEDIKPVYQLKNVKTEE